MFGSDALDWVADIVAATADIMEVVTQAPVVYFVYLALASIVFGIAVRMIRGA